MRRSVALLVLLSCILGLFGCTAPQEQAQTTAAATTEQTAPTEDVRPLVGISMPTRQVQRWVTEGQELQRLLEDMGLQVMLQYAEDDAAKQADQLKEMMEAGAQCLVVTAVDSLALLEVLDRAKEENIPVLAYDRLLMNTDAVTGYMTFDSRQVGRSIGDYIVETKALDTAREEKRSHTIEFFMGSPDDNNALLVYEGIMEVLQPYLDSGELVCKSGKTLFEDTCVLRWSQETARQYCLDTLNQHYAEEKLEIVCTAYDGLAYGCIEALETAGYTEQDWPLITGQDAELQAVKYILGGKQTMTVFKDAWLMTQQCAEIVKTLLEGKTLEVDHGLYENNNVYSVPVWLHMPMVVDKSNYENILYGSDYYTKEQLEG